MKDLIIPTLNESKEKISIFDIPCSFNGLIIGYLKNKAKCYIQFESDYSQEYTAYNGMNFSSCSLTSDESLIDLVQELIRTKICDSFKVIEFEN